MNYRNIILTFIVILLTACHDIIPEPKPEQVPSPPELENPVTEVVGETEYSGTLPVLYINTDGYLDIVSKEEYQNALWWIDAMGIEGYESIGSAAKPLGMQIKGRGNSTWESFDKKPYRLKLDDKVPLLGMPSNRH